jgi:hypothetical protein
MRQLFIVISICLSIQLHAQQWGVPPAGWGDFAIGLTDDATRLGIITTAKATTGLHYRVRYINEGVNIATNWYSHLPSGGLATNFITQSNAIGMRAAFNIYMLQEDAGADVAIANMASLTFMQQYFWNIRDVAQKANGNKVVFVIEPDTWGYLIKKCFGVGPTNAGGNATIRPNLVFCNVNNLGYAPLAGLPNTMAGMAQGIIKMIRTYAPDAYIGFHTNHWACWSNGATGASCLGAGVPPGIFFQCQAGLPFWNNSDIDYNANFQIAWYQELLGGSSACDRGDFLVVEKYGFDEGGRWIAFGAGASVLYYGNTEYQKWRYWSKKLAQGLNMPLLGWQTPIGNSTLPNTMQKYKDTFMENFFANKASYICDGFIGLFMGPGVGASTFYTNGAGATGDDGWFFSNLRTQLDPGRPYNLSLASACGATIAPVPGGCTLPVDFIRLVGLPVDEYSNQLRWEVAHEKDVSHYVVERSADGVHFAEVGAVKAYDERAYQVYAFLDQGISSHQLYYYRVKNVDLDGAFRYSETITIRAEQQVTVSLYPNPFTTSLNLALWSAHEKSFRLKVYDMKGVLHWTELLSLTAGQSRVYALDEYMKSQGAYYVKIIDDATGIEIEAQLVIKQ